MKHLRRFLPLPGILCILAACAGGTQAPSAGDVSPQDRALAQERFENRCSTCHGREGRGDGPMAGSLDPRPRDWTDRAWQDSVDDAWLEDVIAHGGEAVGLSSLMPPSQNAGNPGFIRAMVEIVRSFR